MTINETLKKNYQKLYKITKDPAFEAEFLLAHILQKPREFILAHPEKKLTETQITKYNKLISRRAKGEPIAYLVGYKYFYGNKFLVNKNVLIPRPETELLASQISHHASHISQPINIIDVGTGSGCIIISVAKELENKKNKKLNFIGTDISAKALTVAKKNAKLNHLKKNIKFLQGNLLEPILKSKILASPKLASVGGVNPCLAEARKRRQDNSKFLILANLPYVWKAWKNNCSMNTIGLKFEPAIALYTEENGLKLYRELFEQVKKLKLLCATCYLLCEIDPRQKNLMKKLIKTELPTAKSTIKKDLAGNDRLVEIEI